MPNLAMARERLSGKNNTTTGDMMLYAGPYLEIFARRHRPGWTCIGNELDGLDIRESLALVAADQALPRISPLIQQCHLFEEVA